MTAPPINIRCPHCMGQNVEPRGNAWWCHDCKKPFEEAAAELSPPEEGKETPQ